MADQKELTRSILKSEVKGYAQILSERGVPHVELSDDDLDSLEIDDLRRIERSFQSLARTPVR